MSSPTSAAARGQRALYLASIVTALAAACTGSVEGGGTPGERTPGPGKPGDKPGMSNPGGTGSGGGGTTPSPPPVAPPPADRPGACKTFDPGVSPLRLMTRTEYDNTVRDLLGDSSNPSKDFPEDGRPARGFSNDVNARAASDKLVAGYMKAAEKLAKDATANMSKLVDCDPAKDGDEVCLNRFFDGFGKRAFRRPLTADERKDLAAAFKDLRGASFQQGLEAVTTIMLMSPQFLYRYEQGAPVTGTNFAKLTSWEVASRLSYLLWGSMPDNELLAAAEADKLGKPEEILAQARRMTSDPRFLATVTNFYQQWLYLDELEELEKDVMLLPGWKPELRHAMLEEANKFLAHVLSKDGDGKLGTLLTANYSFMNGPLAAYAGAQGASGDAFAKVTLDPMKSAGVLTMPGFLAVHGNPDDGLTALVFRGEVVREQLLCQPVPDPPPNAQDDNPPFTPQTTAREWSDLRSAKPVCGSCHQLMDPIGFVFENFDSTGRWRTVDKGKPVNAAGALSGTDVDGAISGGVPELGKKLAGSKVVSDCVATQWFRFAAGRMEDKRDACSLETLQNMFTAAKGDVRELFVAFTQTDAFQFRSKGDDK